MENYYSVKQVAAKLGISERTVQRDVKKGILFGKTDGKRFLISENALSSYNKSSSVDLASQIASYCEEHKSEMISLLQKLVSIPGESDSSINQENFAKYIKGRLDAFGIRNVCYGKGDATTIHATFGFAKEGILFDCPLDTTPSGDSTKWSLPPFSGVINEGKMYGRGAADCKGGMVAMIYALLALRDIVGEDNVRVEMVFDGGEQNGEYKGMKLALEKGLDVKAGIIGYAGDANEIAIGARGYHRYTVKTTGTAAHTGSRTSRGVNAISKMAAVIMELDALTFPTSKSEYFSFGSKLTCSMIQGGSAINIVPDNCELKVDVRTTPEVTKDHLDKLFAGIIDRLKKDAPDFCVEVSYMFGKDAYIGDENSDITIALKKSLDAVLHTHPAIVANGPAHIGNLLHEKGIDVIVKGPEGGNVHAYDEWVDINSVVQTASIYAQTVLRYFTIM